MGPNPASDTVNITLSNANENATLEIFNTQGKQVLTSDLNAKQNQIDISELPQGMYILKVTSENGVQTERLLKE